MHPDLINLDVVALEAVKRRRKPVYSEPRLTKGAGRRTTQGKKASDVEHRRREGVRELYEELNQYYQLATIQAVWGCPELLVKGKHGCDHSAS